MAQLDPLAIHLDSKATPIWEQQPASFQDIMAEQVRHAPWMLLSALIHGLLALLLLALLPMEPRPKEEIHSAMQFADQTDIPEPPPQVEPEPQPEVQQNEPTLTQEPVVDPTDTPSVDPIDVASSVASAFDSDQWSTAVGLSGGGGSRYGNRRSGRGAPSGISTPKQEAIDVALKWLEGHQDEDGKWDCDGFMKHDTQGEACDGPGNGVHDVGVTGLALLAFLGDGSTMRAGPYKETIKKGVRWLRDQQQENGLFGTNASNDFVYGHAIATYAMCEAFGLSGYSLLAKNAQNGIGYLEQHRNPYSVWRYQPRDNDNDTSVTGWCVMAYESGKHFDLQVNDNALKLAATWFDQTTDSSGRTGYTKVGEPSSRHMGDHQTRFPADKGEAMTAVSLFCRCFMGQDPKETPSMKQAAELIQRKPPVWDPKSGAIDHYYWYYATYAMYQMGGKYWTDWQAKLDDAVVKPQRKDGNFKGSWDPIGVWGEDGGRVYSTAILTLTLEAYYRYSRLVR